MTTHPEGRTLYPQTPWAILALAVLALAGLIGLDRYSAYRGVIADEAQRLAQQAAIVDANLSRRLQTTDRALTSIREWLPRLSALPDGRTLVNQRLQAMVDSMLGVRTFLVVDAAGETVASNRPELFGRNWRTQERYQTISQDADPAKLYLSAPFKTPLGIWAQSVGKMIPDAQGRFAGYALAILDPEYFSLLLNSVRYAPDMQVTVIHHDGMVIFRTPDAEGLTGQDLSTRPDPLFLRHRRDGLPVTVVTDPAETPGAHAMTVLRTIRPAGIALDKPLVVALSRDRSAILAQWRRETAVRVTLFGAIALMAVLGLVVHQRRQRVFAQLLAAREAERQEHEHRLSDSEQRWKMALEGAGHGVWEWHLDTDAVAFSGTWKGMLGYDEVDIGGDVSEWVSRVHPDDLPKAQAAVQAHLAGETPGYECIHRVRCKDGRWKWIMDRGMVFERDAAGRPLRMVGTHTDITTEKQAEERLRLATDGADLGLWYWDIPADRLEWSDRCKAQLALPPDQPPSFAHFYAAMHPDDRPDIERRLPRPWPPTASRRSSTSRPGPGPSPRC